MWWQDNIVFIKEKLKVKLSNSLQQICHQPEAVAMHLIVFQVFASDIRLERLGLYTPSNNVEPDHLYNWQSVSQFPVKNGKMCILY